ncbi:MAG: hypothetical protein ABI906_11865 [Pseudomonadota bacterium]
MKVLACTLAAGLAGIAATGPAAAFSFAPTKTSFFANGSGFLTSADAQTTIQCNESVKGHTTKRGKAFIDSLVFSGADSACANTAATGLPWRVKATGPGAGKILNAGFTGAVLGSCGPATFPITVSSAGVWAFSATLPPGTPPACFFSGSLPTSPPIKVVP